MPTIARSYVTAGVALLGAGVIAAAPVTTPQPDLRTASWDVSLAAAAQSCAEDNASVLCNELTGLPSATPFAATADSTNVFNIPANLFIALANTPFNFFNALGEGNVQLGSDPNGEFSFQPTFEGVTLTQPDGSVAGLGRNLRYTGSWWLYSPTNILGTDPADPSRYQALTNILVPFPALSVPLGNIVATIAASQLPMDIGCTGTGVGACDDPTGLLSNTLNIGRIAELFSPEGYTFPTTIAPITCSDDGQCYVKDPDGPEVPWSGQPAKLDPATPFTSFYNSLTRTPDFSSITPLTPQFATRSLVSLGNGINTAFNPFVLGTQCAICAPFVPNPDNKPVPGPVFEDPDTTDTAPEAAAVEQVEVVQPVPATQSLSVPATPTASAPETVVIEEESDSGSVSTGPKHREPSTISGTVKQVQERINTSISRFSGSVSDSFKKPSSKPDQSADSSAPAKSSESDSDSTKSNSGSDSGSDD